MFYIIMNILTSFIPSEGDRFDVLPDLGIETSE